MKKCLNCNIKYDDDWYSCPKCGAVLKNDSPRTNKAAKPSRISEETAVEISESAGKVGCRTTFVFFILLILSIFSGGHPFFIVLTLIDVAIIIICIIAQCAVEKQVVAVKSREWQDTYKGIKKVQEEQQRIVENDKMIAFYDKCVENGIHNLDTNAALQKASLIAQTFNLHVACTECYNRGKALKMEKQMNKMLSEEKIKYNMLTKYSEFVGIDKSIKMIKDLIIQDKNQLEELEKTS